MIQLQICFTINTLFILCDSAKVCEAEVLIGNKRHNTSDQIKQSRNQSISENVGNRGADLCLLLGHLLSSGNIE